MTCPDIYTQAAILKDNALKKVCFATSSSPFIRPLILRTFSYETDSYTYEQVDPAPYLKEQPNTQQGDIGVSNTTGESVLYMCHLSRQYERTVIEAQSTDFIIDGDITDLQAGDRFSGTLCQLNSTPVDMITYWELTLIEKVSEQMFTLD